MRSRHSEPFNQPFRQLKALVDKNRVRLTSPPMESNSHPRPPLTLQQEDALFVRAVSDVTRLEDNHHWQLTRRRLSRSIRRGYRGVLIVHGRGLKSPGKPVLKAKVFHWLTRGPLRAYVVALASARACDGGAGATYVLLRPRPIGKRQRCKGKWG